jgi:murein DD-endopeptidase MepM/ murein hydrolase activator NlpD
VRGDGTRVLRVTLPRRAPAALVAAALAAVLTATAIAGDWWHIRQRMRGSAALLAQIDEQQATIDSFRERVGELRREVAGWRDMHARIWEAFGPETPARSRKAGIGGLAMPPEVRPGAKRSPLDELEGLAEMVRREGESLRALDGLVGRARKALAALPSRWPARGPVSSEFGMRTSPWSSAQEFHSGIDIAVDRGTPVRAPSRGTVLHAGPHGDYGIAVILDHGNELRTIYGHLKKASVRAGEVVERGAPIGLTGNTGRSSGPHLHYEIVLNGRSVNPRSFLWE